MVCFVRVEVIRVVGVLKVIRVIKVSLNLALSLIGVMREVNVSHHTPQNKHTKYNPPPPPPSPGRHATSMVQCNRACPKIRQHAHALLRGVESRSGGAFQVGGACRVSGGVREVGLGGWGEGGCLRCFFFRFVRWDRLFILLLCYLFIFHHHHHHHHHHYHHL